MNLGTEWNHCMVEADINRSILPLSIDDMAVSASQHYIFVVDGTQSGKGMLAMSHNVRRYSGNTDAYVCVNVPLPTPISSTSTGEFFI